MKGFERFDGAAARRQYEDLVKRKPLDPAPPASCQTCDDERFVFADIVHKGKTIQRYRPCPDCARPRLACGLPVAFERVTLADVRTMSGNRHALERAHAFTRSTRDLFLTGGVGTGKTMLAAAVANEFCAATRRQALFVSWPMTLHLLQPGGLSEGERRTFERQLFKTVPLLIIDDLGSERDEASDFTRRMSVLTYEARGNAGLRTIITSNLTLDEIAKHQGDDRLASRIAGRADVMVVAGPDQRLRRLRAV